MRAGGAFVSRAAVWSSSPSVRSFDEVQVWYSGLLISSSSTRARRLLLDDEPEPRHLIFALAHARGRRLLLVPAHALHGQRARCLARRRAHRALGHVRRVALAEGAVDKLLVSEGIAKSKDLQLQCRKCKHEWVKRINSLNEPYKLCPECSTSGEAIREIDSTSIIDILGKDAEASNSQVIYISTDTEEGSQLILGFGGLAAVLRYPWMG